VSERTSVAMRVQIACFVIGQMTNRGSARRLAFLETGACTLTSLRDGLGAPGGLYNPLPQVSVPMSETAHRTRYRLLAPVKANLVAKSRSRLSGAAAKAGLAPSGAAQAASLASRRAPPALASRRAPPARQKKPRRSGSWRSADQDWPSGPRLKACRTRPLITTKSLKVGADSPEVCSSCGAGRTSDSPGRSTS
jgi:hypothetical protein